MKTIATCTLLFGLVLTLILIVNPHPVRAGGDDGVKLIGAISVPGNPLAVDISYVDQSSGLYFLADVSNKGVDVFDADNRLFLGRITGGFHGFPTPAEIALCTPPGFDARGPSGVLVANGNRLWVTDYTTTADRMNEHGVVKVFELAGAAPPFTSLIPSATIIFDGSDGTLPASCRADELAFDPVDHIVLVGFPEPEAGGTPFAALISSDPPYTVLGTVTFPGTGGIEQSVWDPVLQRFLLSVPSNPPSFPGEIAVINPRTANVENTYTTNCGGGGLALGPFQHLLVGCSDSSDLIMDATNGNILTTFLAAEVAHSDEVWFNQGDFNFYATSNFRTASPALAVIDAVTDTFLQDVPTGVGSHSVAAFQENNQVFVPIQAPGVNPDVCKLQFGLPAGHGCIFVYANENDQGQNVNQNGQ